MSARTLSTAPRRSSRDLWQLFWNGVGLLVFVVMMFPVYWMVNTAFKAPQDSLTPIPKFLPIPPSLANFQDAINQPFFADDIRNSLVVVSSVVVISIAIAFLGAVAVARLGFRGRKAFIILIIGVQMVPFNALVIPIFLMLNAADALDELPSVIAVYLAAVVPFMIWTLRGFIINIPRELEEAAVVDGCSHFGAFMRILFPLAAPGLVAVSIYAFIQAWNEYVLAYVILRSGENQTLTVWLASFTTNHGVDWGGLMAGATLTAIPVVTFFVFLQRNLVTGLTAGAVKG